MKNVSSELVCHFKQNLFCVWSFFCDFTQKVIYMQCKLQWHKGTAYHKFKELTVQEVCIVPSLIRLEWYTILCQCSQPCRLVIFQWYLLRQKFKLNFSKWLAGFSLALIFLAVTGKFIENYIIKLSEGKCNFNEKNNYVGNFDKKHVLL